MAESLDNRRLAAILCTDVAGYSALMEKDEAGTLAALQALRAGVVDPAVAAHRGRIVKTTGDGFLAEFASAVGLPIPEPASKVEYIEIAA
jgi:adenylate cyclase